MSRRWVPSIVLAAAAVVVIVPALLKGGPVAPAVTLAVLFALVGLALSPRGFPRSVTDAQAREAQQRDGRPIVYWRPGCPFCARLRVILGRDAARVHWVDIWRDPAGAATVRSVTGGDETVPTVVAPRGSFVNPAPSLVRDLVKNPKP